MQATRLNISEVVLIEPRVFGDARGFFYESFNQRAFDEATGTQHTFVQDNHSRSSKGVLRGLHYQIEQAQGKLVRVVRGAVSIRARCSVVMMRSSLYVPASRMPSSSFA